MEYHWNFGFLASHGSFLLEGFLGTLRLTAVCLLAGGILGLFIAVMRVVPLRAVNLLGAAYVALFRNIPAMVLLFWFYYSLPTLTGVSNDRYIAASTAFSLYAGAYFAEIYRAGIMAVERGQWLAGRALGFTPLRLFWYIILPQAIRKIVPPVTNEVMEVVKLTTVAATIAFPETLYSAKMLSEIEYRPVEAYSAAGLILVAAMLPLLLIMAYYEKRLKHKQ